MKQRVKFVVDLYVDTDPLNFKKAENYVDMMALHYGERHQEFWFGDSKVLEIEAMEER